MIENLNAIKLVQKVNALIQQIHKVTWVQFMVSFCLCCVKTGTVGSPAHVGSHDVCLKSN